MSRARRVMQKHRKAGFRGEFELHAECTLLVLVRGEIAEIVESALAGSAGLGRAHQAAKLGDFRRVELARVMRVDSGRRPEPPRVAAHNGDGRARALERAAGDDHVADANGHCSGDDGVPVVVEAVVREVESDVYEGKDHARNAVPRFAASQRW